MKKKDKNPETPVTEEEAPQTAEQPQNTGETAGEQPEEKEEGTEEIVITETVRVYPPAWTLSFGEPLSVLEQRHYSGDWDVLRPAKELEEMNIFTAEKLNELMKEAETIMERWEKSA